MSGWHLHRHRRGPQFLINTTNTGWGLLLGHQWGPPLGHQWGLFHGHGQRAAEFTAEWATDLSFDSQEIVACWHRTFDVTGTFIPYGVDIPPGLTHRGYVLLVARFVPENSVDDFFEAVPAIARQYPVVIVRNSGYSGELDDAARELVADHPLVSWLGHVSNDSLLLSLCQHADVYFHGDSVGGTNPALEQAMAAGAPILARDTVYNREVLGPGFCAPDPGAISTAVLRMLKDRVALDDSSTVNIQRAQEHYSWATVCTE